MGLFKMIFEDRKDKRGKDVQKDWIKSNTEIKINEQNTDRDTKICGIENAADIIDAMGRLYEKFKKE